MLSFIIIGRNEGWRLEKCLQGVRNFIIVEKIQDYEIIYVDSQSTDQSIELAKRYKVDKIYLITGKCNAAISRNIGAANASGQILFFIDGDMELIPGFFQSIMKNGELCYPFMSGIEKDVQYDAHWNHVDTVIRRRIKKDTFESSTGGLFIITKALWDRIGGMDTRFQRSQDLDLGMRLAQKGTPLLRKSQIWVNHYTVVYALRSPKLSSFRYAGLLSRKHLLKIKVQKDLLRSNYSAWILLLSISLCIIFMHIIPLCIYLVISTIRVIRVNQKNTASINFVKQFFIRFMIDITFLFAFIGYWPQTPKSEYKQV